MAVAPVAVEMLISEALDVDAAEVFGVRIRDRDCGFCRCLPSPDGAEVAECLEGDFQKGMVGGGFGRLHGRLDRLGGGVGRWDGRLGGLGLRDGWFGRLSRLAFALFPGGEGFG